MITARNHWHQRLVSLADIQTWLEKRYIANQDAVRAASWILTAEDGTQLARVPEGPSIGQSFRHRDYFHGQGRDYPAGAPETRTLGPLTLSDHVLARLEFKFQDVRPDEDGKTYVGLQRWRAVTEEISA